MRDKRGIGWGTFQLVDTDTGELVAGDRRWGYGLSAEEIEAFLDRGRK
jgi:hypothetical protein